MGRRLGRTENMYLRDDVLIHDLAISLVVILRARRTQKTTARRLRFTAGRSHGRGFGLCLRQAGRCSLLLQQRAHSPLTRPLRARSYGSPRLLAATVLAARIISTWCCHTGKYEERGTHPGQLHPWIKQGENWRGTAPPFGHS